MLRARVPLLAAVAAVVLLAVFAEAGRGSGGTYSLPAGNPVVSGTTITSTWANTTLQDLGTEITNSLDRNGRGGMAAPLQHSSGSAAAPSVTFTNDINSGLYLGAAGEVRMSVSTANTQKWTSGLVTTYVPLTVTGLLTTTNLEVTATSDDLTITPTGPNSTALTATGTGTGHGVVATGGSTNGDGVRGTGVSGGAGVRGTGGAVDGKGVVGQGVAAGPGVEGTGGINGIGVVGIGQGTGNAGVKGTGGSPGGVGVLGVAGSAGAAAVQGTSGAYGFLGSGTSAGGSFTGTGSGHGVLAVGAGYGVDAQTASNSTSTVRTTAIRAYNGDILMSATAPLSTTAFSNTLSPKNITKVWGTIALSGGTATVSDGFNITSATISGASSEILTVTFASSFSSTNYAVTFGYTDATAALLDTCLPRVVTKSTGSVTFKFNVAISGGTSVVGTQCNGTGGQLWNGMKLDLAIFGAQ